MTHPWNCLRPHWIWLWATWSFGRCPCTLTVIRKKHLQSILLICNIKQLFTCKISLKNNQPNKQKPLKLQRIRKKNGKSWQDTLKKVYTTRLLKLSADIPHPCFLPLAPVSILSLKKECTYRDNYYLWLVKDQQDVRSGSLDLLTLENVCKKKKGLSSDIEDVILASSFWWTLRQA